MNILGINCFSHDTSACLVQDGKVVAFVEEERLNKEKHTRKFPDLSIKYCLEAGNITLNEVDYVGFPFVPLVDLARGFVDFLRGFPFSTKRFGGQVLFDASLYKKVLDFRKRWGYKGKIIFVGHHHAHAASSFFASPFEEAAILSIDRGGDYISTLLLYGKENKLKALRKIKNPHSLGSLYTVVTSFLGFKPNSDEGKVMGLAPYGKDTYLDEFRKLVKLYDGSFKIDLSYFTYHIEGGYGVSSKFVDTFGMPRVPESEITERDEDLAWALQKVTEEAAVHLANHLYALTGSKNLCIAGGVGLNSVMNSVILKESPFEEIFIQPAANDAGCSLGAALYIWHQILGKEREYVMEHAYLGPEFSNREIKKTLDGYKVSYKKVDEPEQLAAELLASGKIVGWFQGRMEAGPRALGNRSILADPRDPQMKDILNSKVKHREGFRPFAPSVLQEKAPQYFDNYYPSPFMLLVLPIKKEKQKEVPAVCHVDGTGRLQTVEERVNPKYWRLIKEFEKITGTPLILNTSFNVRGQPIVESPEDALKCYLSTGLDCLIIGNYFLGK